MTKKDYQAIARALFESRQFSDPKIERRDMQGMWAVLQWEATQDSISDTLAADNPRFNRALFIEACETGTCKGTTKREGA
jgi:hypothetical protein